MLKHKIFQIKDPITYIEIFQESMIIERIPYDSIRLDAFLSKDVQPDEGTPFLIRAYKDNKETKKAWFIYERSKSPEYLAMELAYLMRREPNHIKYILETHGELDIPTEELTLN